MATECIDQVNDSIKPQIPPDGPQKAAASGQCYSLYLELKRDIGTMKTSQPLDKLNEENSALRAELWSLKKQCDIVCEERDSLKLALQIEDEANKEDKRSQSGRHFGQQEPGNISASDAAVIIGDSMLKNVHG